MKLLKFLWNIFKHIILLFSYCSSPAKYKGTTYEEWLKENGF